MLSKSSKWELSFVHYITKFNKSRLVCTSYANTSSYKYYIHLLHNTLRSTFTWPLMVSHDTFNRL